MDSEGSRQRLQFRPHLYLKADHSGTFPYHWVLQSRTSLRRQMGRGSIQDVSVWSGFYPAGSTGIAHSLAATLPFVGETAGTGLRLGTLPAWEDPGADVPRTPGRSAALLP